MFNMTINEKDQTHPYRLRFNTTLLAKFDHVHTLKTVAASCSFAGADTLTEAVQQAEEWTVLERQNNPGSVVLLNPANEETPAAGQGNEGNEDSGKPLTTQPTVTARMDAEGEGK